MEVISEFLNYLRFEKNYSDHTITSYERDIIDFNSFLINEELAKDILHARRPRLARNYISDLDSRGFSRKTIARKISSLRTFYTYLVNNSYIDENIFLTVEAPKIPKRLPRVIENDEMEMLFNSIDTKSPLGFRNYLILDLLYSCGLRASELTDLKVSDLNLANKQIKVFGKGSKVRLIPLHDGLVEQLRTYVTYYRPNLLAKGDNVGTKRLLINYKGGDLTPRGLQVILKKIIADSGETFKIHPHMIRHAFATALLNNGANLRSVQELLGHSHLKSTQVYTHVSTATMQQKFNEAHPRTDNNEDDK